MARARPLESARWRGATWTRLDHAGKDPSKSQRGSSAEGDDVDVVWHLSRGDNDSLILQRDVARMSWVPNKLVLTRLNDPLSYERTAEAWVPGTGEVADY